MKDDRLLIEKLSEEELNQEIPLIVKRGLSLKRRNTWIKYSATAATLAICFLVALGVSFPGYARELPLIGGIFEFFFHYGHGDDTGTIGPQEFASEVNLTGEVDGMQVTIEEAVFDGRSIQFTYSVKSDTPISAPTWNFEEVGLQVDGMKISTERIETSSRWLFLEENVYIGLGTLYFFGLENILDYAEVFFEIEDWQVSFPVTRVQDIIIPFEASVDYNGFYMSITRVVFTAQGATVHFAYEKPSHIRDRYLEYVFYSDAGTMTFSTTPAIRIFDNLGNEYTNLNMSMQGCYMFGTSGWFGFLGDIHPDANKLIIYSFIKVFHTQLYDYDSFEEYDEDGLLLSSGRAGRIIDTEEWPMGSIVISIPQ